MRTRLGPVAALALLLSVVLSGLVGCSDGDGDGDEDGGDGELRSPVGTVQEALDLFPADTELVRVVDRSLVTARLGVDDVETMDPPAVAREYAAAIGRAEWGQTELGYHVQVMSRRGAFSELDVTWAARGVTSTPKGFDGASVFALDDDVDLGAVADALVEAGYTEDELAGHRHFTAPLPKRRGLVDGVYPYAVLQQVTVVPDRHLLVTGRAQPMLDVLAGRAESAYDRGAFTEITAQVDQVEYAELRTGGAIDCAAPIRGDGQPSAAEVAAIQEALGMTGLGRPRTTALYVAGEADPRGVTLLEFADAAAARADAQARATWLTAGLDVVTRLTNGTLYDIRSQVADEDTVTVEWTYGENLAPAVRAHQSGAGVAACVD